MGTTVGRGGKGWSEFFGCMGHLRPKIFAGVGIRGLLWGASSKNRPSHHKSKSP